MKTYILIGLLIFAIYGDSKAQVVDNKDSVKVVSFKTEKPCHQFKSLKTSNEYFQSANNRTKSCCCPNDSLTTIVAAKEYELAVKLDPKFWQARRNYARQLIDLKQFEQAIEQLNQALKLVSSETNPDLNVMRGQAFYKLGKYKEAIIDYEIGIKYFGNTDYVHLLKAKAEWKLGQTDKACEDYNIAIKGYPDYEKEKEFIECI